MRQVTLILIYLFLLIGGEDALAGRKEIYNPVLNIPDTPVATSKAVVKKAINDQFPVSEFKQETDDAFGFRFTIRSHSADLMVRFTEDSIAFEFMSAVNLDYKEKKGKRYIHGNYNAWMQTLESTIARELPNAEVYLAEQPEQEEQVAVKSEVIEPPPKVIEGDTEVVVIRRKSMVGAMMSMSVGVNDRLVARLKSSTYCVYKEKAGFVTVYLLQANTPIASVNLDNRPGETVYLLYDYKRGKVSEIPQTEATRYLDAYKKVSNVSKPNPVYLEMVKVSKQKAAGMTKSTTPLSNFNRFELKDVDWSDEVGAHPEKVVVSQQLDTKVENKLGTLLSNWLVDAPEMDGERTLIVQPTVEELRVVSDGARLWVGSWAGGSNIGMGLTLTDGESGDIVAKVRVDHASNAYTDRALMDYIVEIAYQYMVANY